MEEGTGVEDTLYFIFLMMAFGFVVSAFIMSVWAWRLQKKIEHSIPEDQRPEALIDRTEVSFWGWIAAGILTFVGLLGLFRFQLPLRLNLLLFYIGVSIKAIPASRWLWRYYRNKFDDEDTISDIRTNKRR